MAKQYVEVVIRAEPTLSEELSGALSQLGFEGFWEDGDVLKCYISASRWDGRIEDGLRTVVRMMLRPSSETDPPITIRTFEEENWNARWEASIQPLHVTDHLVLAPTWHPYHAGKGETVVTIDPKMAFGTGYHESTRLMLRLLEQRVVPGMRMLDIGTGTGVLAITAILLGAHSATGIDTDEWAYANAGENARLNGVEDRLNILLGDIHSAPPGPFEIVASNIQPSVIEPMLGEMVRRLHPLGTLLLAGLLDSDRDPMTAHLHALGLSVRSELRENEWIALDAIHT